MRIVMDEVKERDIEKRKDGKEKVGEEELMGIIGKMVKKREE